MPPQANRGSPPSVGRYYLVLTGPACAGKSTIGRRLARELVLPFLQRDHLMEMLFETLGWKRSIQWRHWLRPASYGSFYFFLPYLFDQGQPFIIESGFGLEPHEHAERLCAMQRRYRYRPIQVHCTAAFEVLEQRHWRRVERNERHPGWLDKWKDFRAFRKAIEAGMYSPLDLGGTLIYVDTTKMKRSASLDWILREIEGAVPARS